MALEETFLGTRNFEVLACIIKATGVLKMGYGAEIGVLRGETSAHLLREFPKLILYSIDPYLGYEHLESERTQAQLSEFEEFARTTLSDFGDRSRMLKMTSLEAAQIVPDNSLDFVFIDALHTYEAVTEDIAAWYPKLRIAGLLAGHDYGWPAVAEAVNEFHEKTGLKGYCTPELSDIWFFIKGA